MDHGPVQKNAPPVLTIGDKLHALDILDQDLISIFGPPCQRVLIVPFENLSTLRAAFVQPNLRNLRNLRIIHLLETYLRWQILLPANELVNFHFVI